MDKILVLFAYLINSVVCINLAFAILGLHTKLRNGIFVGVIGGIADYFVKEILVPYLGLFEGFHYITSLFVLMISSYYLMNLKFGPAISSAIISHIVSLIGEIFIVLILMAIFGKQIVDTIKNNNVMLFIVGGILAQVPLVIPLVYLKFKKIKLVSSSMYR